MFNFQYTTNLFIAYSTLWLGGYDNTQLAIGSSKYRVICTVTVFQTESSSLLKVALWWTCGHVLQLSCWGQRVQRASLFPWILSATLHLLHHKDYVCVRGQFIPWSGPVLGSGHSWNWQSYKSWDRANSSHVYIPKAIFCEYPWCCMSEAF